MPEIELGNFTVASPSMPSLTNISSASVSRVNDWVSECLTSSESIAQYIYSTERQKFNRNLITKDWKEYIQSRGNLK